MYRNIVIQWCSVGACKVCNKVPDRSYVTFYPIYWFSLFGYTLQKMKLEHVKSVRV